MVIGVKSHKKKPRKNEEKIKSGLLESMIEREVTENSELNHIQGTKNIFKLEDTVTCVKKYDSKNINAKNIFRSEKQNVENVAGRKGYLVHEFRRLNNFVILVKTLLKAQ